MANRPLFTNLVRALPATVPFVGPEAIERASGRRLRLRLGANESLFGPSPRAQEAMRAAVGDVWMYGDPENDSLRTELARVHGVGVENIVVGCGIDDLLEWIVRAALDPGEIAVTSLGAYPTVNYHVHGHGGRIEQVPYRDDRNDLEALVAAAKHTDARLLYLANPDNPTGTWLSPIDVAASMDQVPPDCIFILDEAYVDFAPAGAVPPLDVNRANVLRLRTFSKAYGMAGARIGYAIGHAETIAVFEKIRLHFGVNRVAQAGALAALGDAAYLRSVVRAVQEGRDELAVLAYSLDLSTLPSATNFVAFDLGTRDRAHAVMRALAERDVFARLPGAPPLDRLVRVTVAPAPHRAAFAEIFAAVIEEARSTTSV